jgi:hypothetical protein
VDVKTIAYIAAAIVIFFGVLFIWGAFSPDGTPGWIVIGIISLLAGFAIIYFTSRSRLGASAGDTHVTYKVDLPADVNMDTLKCKSCGGTLSPENVKMIAGAPVVTCPYCGTTYQLTEEPKW